MTTSNAGDISIACTPDADNQPTNQLNYIGKNKQTLPEPILLCEKIYGNKSCYKCNFCEQKGVRANIVLHQLSCDFLPVKCPYSFYCQSCQFVFYYYRAYRQHCQKNDNCQKAKINFMCDICNEILSSKKNFERHEDNQSHFSKHVRKQTKQICKSINYIKVYALGLKVCKKFTFNLIFSF